MKSIARLVLVLVAVGCRRATLAPSFAPIAIEASGCDAVVRVDGRVQCEVLPEQDLRVIAPTSPSATFLLDGQPIAASAEAIEGATRFVLRVRPGLLAIEAPAETGPPRRATLTLSAATKPAWLREANKIRRAGRLDEARALIEPHLSSPSADGVRARALAARLSLARGRPEEARSILRATADELARAGLLSEANEDRFARTWISLTSHDLDDARAALAGLILEPLDGTSTVRAGYARGNTAIVAGDVRHGLALLRGSRDAAARLDLREDLFAADELIATTYRRIGRATEARDRLRALDRADAAASPCRRADRLVSLAIATRTADRSRRGGAEAASILDEAGRVLRGGCPGELALANLEVERAFALLQARQVEAARAALASSRAIASERTGWHAWDWALLDGELALAERSGERARIAFERVEEHCAQAGLIDLQWFATTGRAEALALLGRHEASIATFRAAEDLLDRASLLVPLGEGRALLSSSWERSGRGLVDLLLSLGRTDAAMTAARRARGRIFHGLVFAERLAALDRPTRDRLDAELANYRRARDAIDADAAKDWTLSPADLASARARRTSRLEALHAALDATLAIAGPPREVPPLAVETGTLVLAFHGGSAATIAFAALDGRTVARRVGSDPLDGLDAEIAAARRIRILAGGAVADHDLHARLVDRVPVEYGLDLPSRAADDRAPRIAIVADADGDLPAARAEAAEVAKLAGAATIRLHQAADRTTVIDDLRTSTLFHFAGHASSAEGGFGSALSLAEGAKLTAADVLALTRVPSTIVLSACEAAHAPARAVAEELGIAQAFVVAGARVAIAPRRPVRDRLAAAISRALHGDPELRTDPAAALARATMAARASFPEGDWAAFRAYVP